MKCAQTVVQTQVLRAPGNAHKHNLLQEKLLYAEPVITLKNISMHVWYLNFEELCTLVSYHHETLYTTVHTKQFYV